MKYPVTNLGTGILGPVRRNLGADTFEVEKARKLLERVQADYPNLVNAMGQDKADEAVAQARENLANAEKR